MCLGALGLFCAFGQAPQPAAFEVATVKPNRTGKGGQTMAATPGMLTIHNLSLRTIIGAAYGIAEYQISGPPWLGELRFDIVGKTDASITTEDQMRPKLQPLLSERFHLAMHRDTRQLPAYILMVGPRGPRLEAATEGSAGIPFKKANKPGGSRIRSAHLTMPELAEILSRRLRRPVLDKTELTGAYRVTLEWAADESNETKPGKGAKGKPETDGPTIFTALHDQLGLSLQARKAPIEMVVIDHLDKTPTEN